MPLSYEVYTLHDVNDTMGTLLAYGLNNTLVTRLPIGSSSDNFTLFLKILVLDSLKSATTVIVNVTVSVIMIMITIMIMIMVIIIIIIIIIVIVIVIIYHIIIIIVIGWVGSSRTRNFKNLYKMAKRL